MKAIKIRSPIWSKMAVGVAEYKLVGPRVKIEILYKDKDGNRTFPTSFYIDTGKARSYPVQYVKGHKLFLIPIKDMEVSDGTMPTVQETLQGT